MRLILHTAAYWLMRTVRDAIPKPQPLASGEFSTIRLRLLKIAVRIKETASRIRLAFAANCPDAALFRGLIWHADPAPDVSGGAGAPLRPCRSTPAPHRYGLKRGPASRRGSADVMFLVHNENTTAGPYELDGLGDS